MKTSFGELEALRAIASCSLAVLADSSLPSTQELVDLESAVEAYDAVVAQGTLKARLLGAYRSEGKAMKREKAEVGS